MNPNKNTNSPAADLNSSWRLDKGMAALILIGRQGHFPLFENDWPAQLPNRPLARQEEQIAWRIFKRLAQYPSLERKRFVFQHLKENEQAIFIHSFLNLITNLAWAEHDAIH
jgi:hypothetical protein